MNEPPRSEGRTANKPVVPVLFLICALLFSCGTSKTSTPESSGQGASLTDELRSLVEAGSPASLARAAELLRNRELSEQGRALAAVAAALVKTVYPDSPPAFPAEEGSGYGRIIREAERGVYTAPPSGSRDFFDYVLPFLAYYSEDGSVRVDADRLRSALPHLERAAQLNARSVLPFLFRGFLLEKTGDPAQAEAAYRRALVVDGTCYPAELGLARLLHAQGRYDEESAQLTDLSRRYPNAIAVQKQQARLYAERQDWQRADTLITAILGRNSRDGEFLLLRAKILLDQGLFQQAQQPLDVYGGIDSANRRYILLRARLQAEGLRNREGAITLLRPLVRSDPNDTEPALYLASLLMASARREDVDEGRLMLSRFLNAATAVPEALALAAADSVRRENWREAKVHLDRLLARRRTAADLLNAWKTERALGNTASALAYARELYNQDSSTDEVVSAYVISLIDTGRPADAARIIDQRLASVPGGVRKSRYYYLRSRLRTDEDAVLNDLRSALFEDPRNLDALTAMFEVYHRRRDERRAVYYLKQALAIDPDNPMLKRYETEYRSLLGN